MTGTEATTSGLVRPFANLPRIGMGCWAIGGPFFADEANLGWAGTDDQKSRGALQAAWDAGVRLFDTADVYGAGHSEKLLGAFVKGRTGAVVVSKFGNAFDETTKQMTGQRHDPDSVRNAIDASRKRLEMDCIDVVLLHLNDLSLDQSKPVFDTLDDLRDRGWIGAFGWSTDFHDRADAEGQRDGFVAVEHADNVLIGTRAMNQAADRHGLAQLVRSPLAMGLLTGKYDRGQRIQSDDVRNFSAGWNDWFTEQVGSPHHMRKIAAVRELLTSGGRTLAQGALCWLLARSPRMFPIPGAKDATQAEENAAAMAHGPLSGDIMDEIEALLDRPPEGPPRPR